MTTRDGWARTPEGEVLAGTGTAQGANAGADFDAMQRAGTPRGPRSVAASIASAAFAALAAAALTACGGGNSGTTALTATLEGTQPNCTIEDGASSCNGTVVWSSSYATDVKLMIDGAVASTQSSGSLSPPVTYGAPISVTLQAGDKTVGPDTISAVCKPASFWNGTQCQPTSDVFTVTTLSVADGATLVSATTPITGVATQPLQNGSVVITCEDADDASVSLPVTATMAFNGLDFTITPSFGAYAMLPHRAQCTLSGDVLNGSLASAAFGPVKFTTDTGPAFEQVLVSAGANGLPFLVDPTTGEAVTPTAMAAHLQGCFGAYEKHLARIRTLCAKSSGGLGAAWDIDPATVIATQVDSLVSLFSNGNISVPEVVIAHDGTEFMTRGALQSDGSSNSMVVAIDMAGHTTISWDWAGRADYIVRLVLDDATGQVYAVSRLGLIQTISIASRTVTSTFDAGVTVNDAILSNGKVAMALDQPANHINIVVYDPSTQALMPGVPFVYSGRAIKALSLAGSDLVVSTSDVSHSLEVGALCNLDPVTFVQRTGPCFDQGQTEPQTLTADAVHLFGDLGTSLQSWPLGSLTTPTSLATFDGPIVRARVVQN
jgi:hypothetical protein